MISITPIFILICLTTTIAQPTPPTTTSTPTPAPALAPPTPPNILKILQKAKGFSRFLGLMKRTQIVNRLETDLSNSNKSQGVTIFAPKNKAFSGMKSGALNSLSSDQLAKLVLFHCVENFLSLSDFQAVTNPLITEAGSAENGQFTLNIITTGNEVNFSTGVGNQATVLGTVYSNSAQQLAIYEVDRLLLPMAIFPVPPFVVPPSPAPVSEKSGTDDGGSKGSSDGSSSDKGSSGGGGGGGGSSIDSSSGGCGGGRSFGGVMLMIMMIMVFVVVV